MLSRKRNHFRYPEIFLAALIIVQLLFTFLIPVNGFLLSPRTVNGLPGIITSPWIHWDAAHLLHNLALFIPCALILLALYRQQFIAVVMSIHLLSAGLTWLFAREGIHIGFSGISIGVFMYIVFTGMFSLESMKARVSFTLTLWQLFLFQNIWHNESGISSDAHICGAVSGVFLSWIVQRPLRGRLL